MTDSFPKLTGNDLDIMNDLLGKDTGATPLAHKTLVILSRMFGGLHHLPYDTLRTFPLDESFCIRFKTRSSLSTFDFEMLTTLVFACHDMAIRAEIIPTMGHRLEILFHERTNNKQNEKLMWHPNLKEAVKRWKSD